MQVLKFGGSSVANADNILRVIDIVNKSLSSTKTIVVVSALGGVTDLLLSAASLAAAGDEVYKEKLFIIEQKHLETVKQLIPVVHQSQLLSVVKKSSNDIEELCNGIFQLQELTKRTKDRIASYGELLSSQIIGATFLAKGINAVWKDARELIITDDNYTAANVDFNKTNISINDYFKRQNEQLFIIPGFIAKDFNGITTTLGRGGSDYSAAIIAAALNAIHLQIWTDVSGMMTADPRLAAHAKIIPLITYQEAMELSHFGAKVIYPPTLQPVMGKHIPVVIKNTFAPDENGTIIQNNGLKKADLKNTNIVRGISSISHIALISLEGSGMIGIPGFSKRLFEALSDEKINVILITQSSSEHSICVAIDSHAASRAKQAVDAMFANEIALQKVEPLKVEVNLSIVALVGENMKNHTGISGRMFHTLGRNGVNIRAIAQGSSEKNISTVIATADVRKSINILHEEFFETSYKQVNLFIIGTGNVGTKLLAQLQQQMNYLQNQLHLQVRVAGLSSSRNQLINEEGIELLNWKEQLQMGDKANLNNFIESIIEKNLRNTILVDITASEEVASAYSQLLRKSISVVACNKVAASAAFQNYQTLKQIAREFNCHFLFETNVGAGLPIIATLNDLVQSGDRVHKIQAVLSGTLNFVFNNYDGNKKFADIVMQAQLEGYTEPDPRLDLGGTDVMRKILILAREAGQNLEMNEVINHSFMPEKCMQGTVDDFYSEMEKEEIHFKNLLQQANAAGCKLKFVASYDNGKASVGLQHIDPKHDLYHLYGKDNVVLFYTDRYIEQPLVVKGAGAGAEVTAAGVFADIIRANKT